MVTGAYYPELSGGGLQARAVVRALRHDADFYVLTTSTDRSLPAHADEEGVPIRRVFVDVGRVASQLTAGLRLAAALVRVAPRIDIVNQHGFSRKAILMMLLTRALRKKFVLTLQTGACDEPAGARALGSAAYRAFANADLYLSVSPGLSRAYLDAGLPSARLRQVCNAVDVDRFTPATSAERAAIRSELGLPLDVPLVLFVGFFSRDKRPDLLYRAWARASRTCPSALVFVGATRPVMYQEVDSGLADRIRRQAATDGFTDRIFFVETTRIIDRYYRAADVFVLPSIREGLSIALLEAMSSGLACVASRLPGSTDALIDHGVNGLLVAPDDEDGLAAVLASLVADRDERSRLGAAARQTVIDRFSIQRTAADWLAAYREVSSLS